MPRRVVTLPPAMLGDAAVDWAQHAAALGADLLELRGDLHIADTVDINRLAQVLPLLVSDRGPRLPESWLAAAQLVDRPLGSTSLHSASLSSLHAEGVLAPQDAVARWIASGISAGALVKHVEPLGRPEEASRLFETQRLLGEHFGPHRVTVLATGPLALPFRCLLAPRNALDYLAGDSRWAAATGQRLLEDAVRENSAVPGQPRRGILGSRIAHSRSPRVHQQPFDRIDLPDDAPLGELLDALQPHYSGFAVTAPFKKAAAEHVKAPFPAINTLVRRSRGWDAFNTDVAGARETLRRLGTGPVTVLGEGGATTALRVAAANERRALRVVRRAEAPAALSGLVVWTWPDHLAAPATLRFEEARVAVIAYGAPGRRVAEQVRQLGGTPVRLGAAWFIAQAREQRRFWQGAADA